MAPKKVKPALIIGWREEIALPELGIEVMRAKIDTGARTSAIHGRVDRIYEEAGKKFVAFRIPVPGKKGLQSCVRPLFDQRAVKNTSGVPETRCVIRTLLVIGDFSWPIDVTIADREKMTFDIILGRTAIRTHNICVHPGRSYLAGSPQTDSTENLSA